jgi:hypothetical protein
MAKRSVRVYLATLDHHLHVDLNVLQAQSVVKMKPVKIRNAAILAQELAA